MGESSEAPVNVIETALDDTPVTLGVLHGSHARGEATDRSDVDLAVVFEDRLSSIERTRARLELIERLCVALDSAEVDVIPLVDAPPELRREICADGVVIVGTSTDLEAYCHDEPKPNSHRERLAEFDDLLTEIERVV